jgi:RNA polymerase sigma-32 factor
LYTSICEEDLIQAGAIGLMTAIRKYDLKSRVKLITFATHYVREEMYKVVYSNIHNAGIKVVTSKKHRKLFHNLYKFHSLSEYLTDDKATKIAEHLDMKPSDIIDMHQRLMPNTCMTIDIDDNDDSDDYVGREIVNSGKFETDSAETMLIAFADNDQHEHTLQQLHEVINTLGDRDKEIIVSRWLLSEKATLHDLSDKFGVSAERIRQIEKSAMSKIKKQLRMDA